jgi:acyl carrier protein
MNSIEAQIRDYLSQYMLFNDESFEFSDDDSFVEQRIIDSMSVMEVVMFVEETFGVEVADTDITLDNFDSVSKLARYIRMKTAVSENAAD